MTQLASFRECCVSMFAKASRWNPESATSELMFCWVQRTEPGLNDQQKAQLRLLYDSMEHRKDGTISQFQLQNVTEWILPNAWHAGVLEFLFRKFHADPRDGHRISASSTAKR